MKKLICRSKHCLARPSRVRGNIFFLMLYILYSILSCYIIRKLVLEKNKLQMHLGLNPRARGVRRKIQGPESLERGCPCWLLKLSWMETQRVQMKGLLPWLVRSARCAGTRDFCPALAALVGLVQKKFSHRTLLYFTSFVSIAQQAGQAVLPGRLSLNMCICVPMLWSRSRSRNPKLTSLPEPEPKFRIAAPASAPAPFYLP